MLSEALVSFLREDASSTAASIAYFGILSLFPLLLLFVVLTGTYVGRFELGGQLVTVLERYLPIRPDFILRNLATISRLQGRVTIISLLLLLWASSGVFMPLEKAMNRAWGATKNRPWWQSRLLALEMAIILGFLILVSTALAGTNVFVHRWVRVQAFHPAGLVADFAYHMAFVLATFGLTLTMFLMLFQRLPNRPLRLRQVFPGAVLTALFWEGARSLFTLILPLFNWRHVYGSIGVVVALMTWAYFSSAVILFGAQVSSVLYSTLEAEESEASPPAGSEVGDGWTAEMTQPQANRR